jgi:hypothetical protein
MEDKRSDEEVFKEFYDEALHSASTKYTLNKLKRGLKTVTLNLLPTGVLPYFLQKKIVKHMNFEKSEAGGLKEVKFFKPKLASILSSAYLGALGYWLYNAGTQTWEVMSTYSKWTSGGWENLTIPFIYVSIPGAVLAGIGAYFMVNAIRAPISYLSRPCGDISTEGAYFVANRLKKLFYKNKKINSAALEEAQIRFTLFKTQRESVSNDNDFSAIRKLNNELYVQLNSHDEKSAQSTLLELNEVRKRHGLTALKLSESKLEEALR